MPKFLLKLLDTHWKHTVVYVIIDSIPRDLAAAIEAGRIPGSIVHRFFALEKSPFLSWLLRLGGFKEGLFADDIFLTKVAIDCGVGIFTKIMAINADFMLVWLPAPTVPLRPALATSVGGLNKFFYSCHDNAFQVASAGTSYSLIQRIGAVVRNGAKLFVIGTSASLFQLQFLKEDATLKVVSQAYSGSTGEITAIRVETEDNLLLLISSDLFFVKPPASSGEHLQ